ncbi:MAG: GPW/gp25 family protein [bacterium]
MRSYNIKFPINDDTEKNRYFAMNRITKDAFSSDLLLLLLTQKGERYYEPNYGTNLQKYIFDPNDNFTEQDVEQEIKRTVSLYIPNLKINNITFNRFTDDRGLEIPGEQLNVNIKFVYTENSFSEAGELDLNF